MISGRSDILRHFDGRPIADILKKCPDVLVGKSLSPVEVCLIDRLDLMYSHDPMELYVRLTRSRNLYVSNDPKPVDDVFRTESVFTCRSCGSDNCIYTEQQLRSADEPMHRFVQCLDCKSHQVFSN